ncbi:MAG: hypothetical protein KBA61_03445 [Spirochaetes bacterium]|nr:hypothetical protein [Spirochaetota bacterium]
MIPRAQAARLSVAFGRLHLAIRAARTSSRPLPPYYQQRQTRDREMSEFYDDMGRALESGSIEKVLKVFHRWESRSPEAVRNLKM